MSEEGEEFDREMDEVRHKALLEGRAICADCGMPQPDDGALHFDGCPGHDSRFCLVCKKAYEDSGGI